MTDVVSAFVKLLFITFDIRQRGNLQNIFILDEIELDPRQRSVRVDSAVMREQTWESKSRPRLNSRSTSTEVATII